MNSSELGFLFWDKYRKNISGSRNGISDGRLKFFKILLYVGFGIIVLRLVWLQLIEGEKNLKLSEENRIFARRIAAPRGAIMDRNGEVLVQNVPVFKKKVEGSNDFIVISREEALSLEMSGKGDEVITSVGRYYKFGADLAHVLGYVGEVDEQELREHENYDLGSLIGKMGVELEYEDELHGIDGAELLEVDVNAKILRDVSRKEPVSGNDLKLTIDAGLQKKAYELLDGRSGGLVALDPKSGEVLTLVSSPSFDPNKVAESLEREDQPFFNRMIGGLYPPGSVFKVVTAIAGLEEGKIDAITEIEDTGEIRVGTYRYGNWYFDQYGRKEGPLNIIRAIKRSNDIFFYKLGEIVGAKMLWQWAQLFGYGKKTGIDLPGEVGGLVPSPLWKEREKGERWFLGNTYHFAIGQSDLQVTPLQVAQMTSIAASGKLCKPHVLHKNIEEDEVYKESCEKLDVEEKNLDLVQEGMREACSAGGTAFPFFEFGVEKDGKFERIEVGCKTGTAEFGDPEDRTHAWFTVFAPFSNPEIAVTVLLEKAGEGSYEAAPVAKEFLKYYFEKK